jgi:hypothetical protein
MARVRAERQAGDGVASVRRDELAVTAGDGAPGGPARATATAWVATPIAVRQASAMPRTGAPPTMGETPTTGAAVARSASRTPATCRIVPTETTGFDGGSSTTSASEIASSTPGPGFATSTPTSGNASAGSEARCRTHHSWK